LKRKKRKNKREAKMPSIGTKSQIEQILNLTGGFQVHIGKAPNELAVHIKRKNVCTNCHKRHQMKLMTCGECKMTRYCNAECQKADWINHKRYCGSQHKCCDTKTLDLFSRDVMAHLMMSAHKGEESVLNSDGRVWAYKSEDDTGYMIEMWKTPQLIAHLKKIGVDNTSLRWHVKKLLEGTSFLVYKEGQVMAMQNTKN
jgi:hypothetical protein